MMDYKCIIFDSDGVLVDSESLSATVFQQMAVELGFMLDFESAVEHFAGTSMKENLSFIEENIQGDLPGNFEKEYRDRSYSLFKKELKPIPGIHDLIAKLKVPYCVASSGPVEKISLNLSLVNLLDKFEGRIYSCYDIARWKPEPGIFLHAAMKMGFAVEDCIVVEDSATGISAALAGGFRVYALARGKRKKSFERMGAISFASMKELEKLLEL